MEEHKVIYDRFLLIINDKWYNISEIVQIHTKYQQSAYKRGNALSCKDLNHN